MQGQDDPCGSNSVFLWFYRNNYRSWKQLIIFKKQFATYQWRCNVKQTHACLLTLSLAVEDFVGHSCLTHILVVWGRLFEYWMVLSVKSLYLLKGVQKVTCLHAIKPTNCGGWGKYFLILDAENRNTKQSQKKTEEIRKPYL